MKKVINFGSSANFSVQSSNVDALRLNINATHTTANTAFSAVLADLSEITIDIEKELNGHIHKVYKGIALPFLMASTYMNASFEQIVSGTVLVEKAHASGVKAIASQIYDINFGGIFNLDGDEKLNIEIDVPSAAAGTGVDTALSGITLEVIEGIGYEIGTPQIIVKNIQASLSEETYSLGSDVQSIYFINTDKTTNLSADRVIDRLTIESDKVKIKVDSDGLISDRLELFPTIAQANLRNNNFVLHSGAELDDCKIDLTFNSANVNASKNYLVIVKNIATVQTVAKVQALQTKHEQKAVRKLRG